VTNPQDACPHTTTSISPLDSCRDKHKTSPRGFPSQGCCKREGAWERHSVENSRKRPPKATRHLCVAGSPGVPTLKVANRKAPAISAGTPSSYAIQLSRRRCCCCFCCDPSPPLLLLACSCGPPARCRLTSGRRSRSHPRCCADVAQGDCEALIEDEMVGERPGWSRAGSVPRAASWRGALLWLCEPL
jgi:hypothetical protein